MQVLWDGHETAVSLRLAGASVQGTVTTFFAGATCVQVRLGSAAGSHGFATRHWLDTPAGTSEDATTSRSPTATQSDAVGQEIAANAGHHSRDVSGPVGTLSAGICRDVQLEALAGADDGPNSATPSIRTIAPNRRRCPPLTVTPCLQVIAHSSAISFYEIKNMPLLSEKTGLLSNENQTASCVFTRAAPGN
jgi:hypothetical protein